MKNKKLIKVTLNIPEYMYGKIMEIDETHPGTTKTSTILAILEKGLNWYAKAKRKAQEQSLQTPEHPEAGQASTVDQGNNKLTPEQQQEVDEWMEELYGKNHS